MRLTATLTVLVLLATHTAWGQADYLEQGWDDDQREEFYFTAQGSQLIPFKWFLALEQADNTDLFRSDQNIRRFGFLPAKPSALNPHGLPIGFVRDGVDSVASDRAKLAATQRSVIRATTRFAVKENFLGATANERDYPKNEEATAWFGLTCAACHTHEMRYKGNTVRIDGGSSQADLQTFLADLGKSLTATLQDPVKFRRFATKVGRGHDELENFRREVKQIADAVNNLVHRNASPSPYRHARLDAFGAILNAVCETALRDPSNHRTADAPVSYPSLWNTPRMQFVQWNASAGSAEGRNVGEVLGVFGNYTLEPGPTQFDSTVRLRNLIRLEHDLVAALRAPDWPQDQFGRLDPAKIAQGKKLFAQNCVSCHAVRKADGEFTTDADGRIPIRSVTKADIKTDPQFLDNLDPNNPIRTGVLSPLFGGTDRVSRTAMLGGVVQSIIANRLSAEQIPLPPQFPPGPGDGYIARPLEGIWASAPYFHNGSVPNLYETLLPAAERTGSFWVGGTDFDPKDVGFVRGDSTVGSEFHVTDDAGETITGNSNLGHSGHTKRHDEGFTQTFEDGDWRDFSKTERYALIEYMKSLSATPAAAHTAALTPVADPPATQLASTPVATETPAEPVEFEQIPGAEAEQIENIVRLTSERMRRLYAGATPTRRGVHPKDHGCVTAKFVVSESLPPGLSVGVFQPGASYDAYIRFSNADVEIRDDSPADGTGKRNHGSRGMAIKLLGVSGDSLLPLHGALTQDFVMVNQPAFAFANVEDYELLSEVLIEHFGQPSPASHFFARRFAPGTPLAAQARAKRTLEIVQRIQADTVDGQPGAFSKPPASAADNPYYSAAPFLFGPDRVMKFRVDPVARSSDAPDIEDPNYLRNALIKRLQREAIEFDFGVQVRTADQLDLATDIENASTEWDDTYVSVGKLTIPIQTFDSPEQRERCERLFFTPWHGVTDHRPLGGINRLRKSVYLESGKHRNLPKEPASTASP